MPSPRSHRVVRLAADRDADQRLYHTIVLGSCAGVLAASFVLHVESRGLSLFGWPLPLHCGLYETLGIRCALCGMSRSFASLAHGDIGASLAFHPLGPVVFGLFIVQIPYRLHALLGGPGPRRSRLVRIHAGLVAAIGAALLLYWLLYLGGQIP